MSVWGQPRLPAEPAGASEAQKGAAQTGRLQRGVTLNRLIRGCYRRGGLRTRHAHNNRPGVRTERADATLCRLIAGVSHDLRTPLTSLRLLVDALRDGIIGPEERAAATERMRTQIDLLTVLTEDLFELARLQTGDINWSFDRVCLPELVADAVSAMHAQADQRSVVVRNEIASSLDDVNANPEKVRRVLFNLMGNAIRHTPRDGTITISAERVNGSVELEVADTGAGIAHNDQDRIFDAFIQGNGATPGGNGACGLGLAISRAIIEAHGGRIWLADPGAPGTGARVRFSLPVATHND